MSIPVAVEHVWCSGRDTHHDLRSKIKTVRLTEAQLAEATANPAAILAHLSRWNFDGSSTGQATGKDTEILIQPVAAWPHPTIAKIAAFAVLCECYLPSGEPTPDNTRAMAREVFEAEGAAALEPWFGLEQEYVLYKDGRPVGWPADGSEPAVPQGPYYCSNGAEVAWGRALAEEHYVACLRMGLTLSGMNAEVMPGQWEYQVGPCTGIASGDHALMARWAFLRILEPHGADVNFECKPKTGDWNGSGMHTNYSTAPMRAEGGFAVIEQALARLAEDPLREIAVYGADNDQRMTGAHETSRLDRFDFGVGTRGTSCRVPNDAKAAGKGYFEDRRPSSSADPYLVTARLFATTCAIPAPRLEAHVAARPPAWLPALRERVAAEKKAAE